jgi:hypothetical protein
VAIAIFGVAALAIAGAALAVTRTKTVTVPANNGTTFGRKTATAHCPGDQRVVLGGFRAETASFPDDADVVISALDRKGSGDWKATGDNDQNQAGDLTAIAYCGQRPRTKRVVAGISVPAGDTKDVTAVCPRGKKVLFGGFFTQHAITPSASFPYPVVNEMRRVKSRRLRVRADNIGNVPAKVRAIAFCGHGPKLQTASQTEPNPANSRSSATAHCPAGTRLAFGGFRTPSETLLNVVSGLRRAAGGWRASASNEGGTPAAITAYAYCG